MSLSASTIDALVAAGVTAEQLAAAMKAELAAVDAARVAKRAKWAMEKAAQRAAKSAMSADVYECPSDIGGHERTPSDPSLDKEGFPTPLPRKLNPPVDNTTRGREAEALMGVLVAGKLAKDRARAAKAERPSRRCPTSWMPSPADCAVGEADGMTPGEIERALAAMRDHEFRTTRSDWSATFRNWLREDATRKKTRRPANDRSDHDPAQARRDSRNRSWAGVFAEERGPSAGDGP